MMLYHGVMFRHPSSDTTVRSSPHYRTSLAVPQPNGSGDNIGDEFTLPADLPTGKDTLPPLPVVGGVRGLPDEDVAVVPKLVDEVYRGKSYQCLQEILPEGFTGGYLEAREQDVYRRMDTYHDELGAS